MGDSFEDWLVDFDNKPPIIYPLVWITWLILFILFLPILLAVATYKYFLKPVFYKFPLYLIGFWWCYECKKRFNPKDKKVIISIHDYSMSSGHYYKYKKCCNKCYGL